MKTNIDHKNKMYTILGHYDFGQNGDQQWNSLSDSFTTLSLDYMIKSKLGSDETGDAQSHKNT